MKSDKEKSRKDIEWAREVLGLGESATLEEIKFAYRRACKKWHPDVRIKDEESNINREIQDINRAYHLLLEFIKNYRYVLVENNEENFDADSWWWEKFGSVFAGNVKTKNKGNKQ